MQCWLGPRKPRLRLGPNYFLLICPLIQRERPFNVVYTRLQKKLA